MLIQPQERKLTRILVLLWHPHSFVAIAGGFKVADEVLKRTPADVGVDAIDVKPSFLEGNSQVRIFEYKVPDAVWKIERRSFAFGKVLEFLLSMILAMVLALKLVRRKRYNLIYVPCAELLNTTLVATTLRFLFHIKVVQAVLSIEALPHASGNVYSQRRKEGYPVAVALLSYIVGLFPLNIWLHNKSDAILTHSQHVAQKISVSGINRNINVVPTGIDYKFIKGIPNQKKIYDGIFIGRHTPEKGIFDIVKMWKIVVEKLPNAKIALVGSSDEITIKRLIEEIRRYGIEKNIVLFGTVSEYEKVSLLKRSKAVVFLSYIEGWGLVPIEGLACGLPVVAYNLPVYREHIGKCEAAFLVPVGDYREAAKKLTDILAKNEGELFELSQRAEMFARQYDWDELAEDTFKVLRKVAWSP
jgi:glycosyltransferase involved in cell wall biosynthesis